MAAAPVDTHTANGAGDRCWPAAVTRPARQTSVGPRLYSRPVERSLYPPYPDRQDSVLRSACNTPAAAAAAAGAGPTLPGRQAAFVGMCRLWPAMSGLRRRPGRSLLRFVERCAHGWRQNGAGAAIAKMTSSPPGSLSSSASPPCPISLSLRCLSPPLRSPPLGCSLFDVPPPQYLPADCPGAGRFCPGTNVDTMRPPKAHCCQLASGSILWPRPAPNSFYGYAFSSKRNMPWWWLS